MIPYHVQQVQLQQDLFNHPTRKEELIKIFLQALSQMGYEKTVEQLSEESQITLETDQLIKFRQSILLGQWVKAINLLQELKLSAQDYENAVYTIYEHKYYELLESRNNTEALQVIRQELPQVCKNSEKLHQLASLLIIKNIDDFKKKVQWMGTGLEQRKALLAKIYEVCKPLSSMLGSNRLQKIVKQSKLYQVAQCKYHYNLDENFTIFDQHVCTYSQLPNKVVCTLTGHKDEVWIVKFSPTGEYIVSIAKNLSMIIWKFQDDNKIIMQKQVLKCHSQYVYYVVWNATGELIATASADKLVKVWNLQGNQLLELKGHSDIVTSVLWHPYEKLIFTAGLDPYILVWSQDGKRQLQINSERTGQLHISYNGKFLVVVGLNNNRISIIDYKKKSEVWYIQEKDSVQSSAISSNSKYILLMVASKIPELHLWSLESQELINKFVGFKQQNILLRCCLGGQDDAMIACGSEDGKLFIWHRNYNKPLKILNCEDEKDGKPNKNTINCVSWHPTRMNLIVSAHDDKTIKIWSTDQIKYCPPQLNKFYQLYQNMKCYFNNSNEQLRNSQNVDNSESESQQEEQQEELQDEEDDLDETQEN